MTDEAGTVAGAEEVAVTAEMPNEGVNTEQVSGSESPAEKPEVEHSHRASDRIRELVAERNEERARTEQLARLLETVVGKIGSQDPDFIPTPPRDPNARPTPDQFRSDLEYVEALTDWKMDQKLAEQAQRQEHQKVASTLDQREALVREKHADYSDALDGLMRNETLIKNPLLGDFIRESEHGPEVAYQIGKDRALQADLAKMPAYRLAAKLAAMEDAVTAKPATAKPASTAPAPVSPISGGSAPGSTTFDVNDSKLSYAEWKKGRQAQLAAQKR